MAWNEDYWQDERYADAAFKDCDAAGHVIPEGAASCACTMRGSGPLAPALREPASAAPDVHVAHVAYVPGEDPGIAALREMVNGNRRRLGIDGDGGGEER